MDKKMNENISTDMDFHENQQNGLFDRTVEYQQGRTEKKSMNYQSLKELVHRSSNEILFTLCNPNEGLDRIIFAETVNKEVMAYALIAIGKACESHCENNVAALISMIVDNKNFILCSLQRYLISLVASDASSHHKKSLQGTIKFLCSYQQYFPASASEITIIIFPLLRDICRSLLGENSSIEETLTELFAENNRFLENHTLAQVKANARYERLNSKLPPESYRCIPVLPDVEDIFSEEPFVRPNLVNCKYVDADHYLDVQFRLLREDFIRPLRKGINEYKNQIKEKRCKSRIQNIHVYENVHITGCKFLEGIRMHTVLLDLKTLPNIRWDTCKRFLHGSLVCISSDNYQTMHFASVLKRDIKKLKKSEIIVSFKSSDEIITFDSSTNFTMIETNAFFEAYRHNLDVLQKMEAENFPFKEYILKLEGHVKPPVYLQSSSTYNMTTLLSKLHLEDFFNDIEDCSAVSHHQDDYFDDENYYVEDEDDYIHDSDYDYDDDENYYVDDEDDYIHDNDYDYVDDEDNVYDEDDYVHDNNDYDYADEENYYDCEDHDNDYDYADDEDNVYDEDDYIHDNNDYDYAGEENYYDCEDHDNDYDYADDEDNVYDEDDYIHNNNNDYDYADEENYLDCEDHDNDYDYADDENYYVDNEDDYIHDNNDYDYADDENYYVDDEDPYINDNNDYDYADDENYYVDDEDPYINDNNDYDYADDENYYDNDYDYADDENYYPDDEDDYVQDTDDYDRYDYVDNEWDDNESFFFAQKEEECEAYSSFSADDHSSRIKHKKNPKQVNVLDYSKWPSMKELDLDESQYEALRSAITKEFAIIQGPPGTGKTFMGQKIVQLLLSNSSVWQSDTKSPILIVCYTNHALDQFLEGLLRFTKKLVRIGGRCSNEKLSKYKLRNLKYKSKARRKKNYFFYGLKKPLNDSINKIQNEMAKIYSDIVKCDDSVMDENLWRFITDFHCNELESLVVYERIKNDYMYILNWLGINNEDDYMRQFSIKNGVREILENEEIYTNKMNGSLRKEYKVCRNASSDTFEESKQAMDHNKSMRNVENKDLDKFWKQTDIQQEANAHPIKDVSEWQLIRENRMTKQILEKLKRTTAMSIEKALKIRFISTLSFDERWKLYKFWKEEHLKHLTSEYHLLEKKLEQNINELKEIKNSEDLDILKHAEIVGMTTTGAAKYRDILVGLSPRIVIAEEAAEVLEAHIITALAKDTQHLILIGDHQQLRPSTNVYELAVGYNLDLSLFERMVNNGVEYCQLKIQHRMRPCISSLIVPHIYPALQNHVSVTNFSDILGITKNMFFVKHAFPEKQNANSTSKINLHEASFMVELCKYFLHQGYSGSQITILTTYSDQVLAMRNMTRGKDLFSGVQITVVDNFQGEENDIILMSFVRSNEEGKIGFLNIPNRVCVALSRAKKGFFCIGNFDLLSEKSTLWKNIVKELEKQNAIGPSLKLQCQNHPNISTLVSEKKDFAQNVPEGGCAQLCGYELKCGHYCSLKCHPYDPHHSKVKCNNNCSQLCASGHRCPLKCFQQCRPCTVLVKKQFPQCEHKSNVLCHSQDIAICPEPCQKTLKCQHRCSKICGESCEPCMKAVSIDLPCGHKVNVKCYESLEKQWRRCWECCGYLSTNGNL